MRAVTDNESPGVVVRGNTYLITRLIETRGPWSGKVWINVELRGRFTRSQSFYLPLTVSDSRDDAPFLRRR